MSDRELLEDAAKAAGIELVWRNFSNVPTLFKGLSSDEIWNPLTDDGDALRLAVKLELEMYFGDDESGTSVHVGYAADPDSASMVRYCIQPSNDDPLAATRRAIVRAAAEIGRSMT